MQLFRKLIATSIIYLIEPNFWESGKQMQLLSVLSDINIYCLFVCLFYQYIKRGFVKKIVPK